MKEVRIGQGLQVGWEGMKNNWLTFLGLLALYIVAAIVQNTLSSMLGRFPMMGLLMALLSMGLSILLSLVLTKFGLQVALVRGGKAAAFGDMDLSADLVGRFILANLLFTAVGILFVAVVLVVGLVVAGAGIGIGALADKAALLAFIKTAGLTLLGLGFALFAVLLYLLLAYSFTMLVLLHQGLGVFESLAESKRLAEGVKFELFLMYLAFFGVAILGVCALGVGLIPAFMVLTVALPSIYLDLLDQSGPRV